MDFDVIVAGAGPAGSITARDLARKGFRVGLFEAGTKETIGKPIIVEVENSVFSLVGIARPTEDEIPYHPKRTRVFSPRGRQAFSFESIPTVPLFLDQFSRALLNDAETSGVKFFDGHKAVQAVVQGNSVRGAVFRHKGRKEEVCARLVIDATGFDAALVRTLDPDMGIALREAEQDVVVAANYYHEIHLEKATEAVRNGIHGDGELRITLGTLGAYSTEFSYLCLRKRRAYVLIGHKAESHGLSIEEAVQAFKTKQGYYGRRLAGGKGHICIGHTLDRLVCDGFMVVGEAARMVIPINGSGVSSALLAAQLAARVASHALESGGQPSTESLWPFAVTYHRGRGAILATLDAMRLMSERMSSDQISRMLESGLSGPEDMINASTPGQLFFFPASLPRRVRALYRNPDLIRPVLKTAAVTCGLYWHYRQYPLHYEPKQFRTWSDRGTSLFSALR